MPTSVPPQLIIIAGPNGAGKSTTATRVLPLGTIFVNADEIAKLLPEAEGSSRDRAAGREAISEFRNLVAARETFAIETTLSGKALAARIHAAKALGYEINLMFLYLPDAEHAVNRVRDRVSRGGHGIPEEVVRRRYDAGLQLFFSKYRHIVTTSEFADNGMGAGPRTIAQMSADGIIVIYDHDLWYKLGSRFESAE